MSEYTPTVEDVRSYYVEGRLSMHDGFEFTDEAQFDRWLAAVIREEAAKAWGLGYFAARKRAHGIAMPQNPYRKGGE